jgi:hypothetical protein
MVMALCARFETILVLSAIVLVRSMKGDAFILGPRSPEQVDSYTYSGST